MNEEMDGGPVLDAGSGAAAADEVAVAEGPGSQAGSVAGSVAGSRKSSVSGSTKQQLTDLQIQCTVL